MLSATARAATRLCNRSVVDRLKAIHGFGDRYRYARFLIPTNLYSESWAGISSCRQRRAGEVYVPDVQSNRVDVIDPATLNIVDQFRPPKAAARTPSWISRRSGWLAAVAARTRKPYSYRSPYGKTRRYDPSAGRLQYVFQPNGKSAIVVAEGYRRLSSATSNDGAKDNVAGAAVPRDQPC